MFSETFLVLPRFIREKGLERASVMDLRLAIPPEAAMPPPSSGPPLLLLVDASGVIPVKNVGGTISANLPSRPSPVFADTCKVFEVKLMEQVSNGEKNNGENIHNCSVKTNIVKKFLILSEF